MLEGSLNLAVSPPASVVVVERREDVVRVHSVNELDLGLGEMSPVDGEGVDPHPPQSDGIKCSLGEDDDSSMLGVVVEEEPGDVNPLGIEVLGSVSLFEWTTDDTQDRSIWSA